MKIQVSNKNRYMARSGVYVGGLGTGGFEIRPDGTFVRSRMANEWVTEPDLEVTILHEYKGKTRVLKLDDIVRPDTIIKGVDSIIYEGGLSSVKMTFPGLPVELEFRSAFIPKDLKNTTLPAVFVRAKGKGRLRIFFGLKNDVKPLLKKSSVALRAKGGEVLVHSKTGKVSWFSQYGWMYRSFIMNKPVPPTEVAPKVQGKFHAIVSLEGNFNDEIAICWHFKSYLDFDEEKINPYYTNYFKDASSVLRYAIANRTTILRKTDAFISSTQKTGQPQFVKDLIEAQLVAFVKQSWLTDIGEFGVWEGSACCCGLQTTDVAYYGSWLYMMLFPKLEKSGMYLLAKFQRKSDGWIPHFFPGTFSRIDEYRRKDMNMQFALLVYRNYFYWNDKKFLKDMYPVVKAAIKGAYAWDTDGDLIPDIEGPDQTFDQWRWKGCSIFLGTLWIASLKAACEMAVLMGDDDFAFECNRDFEAARETIIKKLWNGKYFSLWNDGHERDEGCILDGLSGDWFSFLSGLGHVLPENMIKSHLKTAFKMNRKKMDESYMKRYFVPGEDGHFGYINGGYKDNKRYCYQQYEPWTGIEFAYAAHLKVMGMEKESHTVLKDVFLRKLKSGMHWNHIECGGDYYRAFSVALIDYI